MAEPATEEGGRRPSRDRKKPAEAYVVPEPKAKAEFKIPEGTGIKLGDVEKIVEAFTKVTAKDDITKKIHKFLFDMASPSPTRVKYNIMQFKGFVFASEDAKKKKYEQLLKWAKPDRDQFRRMLTMHPPENTTAEGVSAALIEYLSSPNNPGGNKFSTGKKRKSSGKGKKVKRAKKAAAAAGAAADGGGDDDDDEEEGEGGDGSDAAGAEEEGAAAADGEGAAAATAAGGKEEAAPAAAEPLAEGQPTDAEIRTQCAVMMKDINMEEASVKSIRASLEEHFKVSLADRKDTVKTIIMENLAA